MKKGTKRLLGSLALAAGAFGAVGAYLAGKKNMGTREQVYRRHDADVWARPGMMVTFRAELMPGREPQERTFRVKELLPSGRVTLHGVMGEHAEKEFMPFR
jgi:hypothetical protein